MKEKKKHKGLRVLRAGDPRSQFNTLTAKEVLTRLGRPRYLLSSSSKIRKGESVGILSKCLYLTSGLFCPAASDGCLASCLGHTSGFMKEQRATSARDRRSALFIEDREAFLELLRHEIHEHVYEAETLGMIPAIRLNGTSDIPWESEHGELFLQFSNVQFYDYTKIPLRIESFLEARYNCYDVWPDNYHLTFSLSEHNSHHAEAVLEAGGNVAVVFDGELPTSYLGYTVIDGDHYDARFLDPSPVVVGLSAKGSVAREDDRTGFVVRAGRRSSESSTRYSNNAA